MLTTKINKEDYKTLEIYFNNYCMFLYSKVYPITNNNLKQYFADVILYYNGYNLDLSILEINYGKFWIDGYYLIYFSNLYERTRLEDFNNYINERINK